MFYEHFHSLNNNYFKFYKNQSECVCFPLHLHTSYEVIFVEKGLMEVEINGQKFDVTEGHGALILPNQPHSLFTPEFSRCWLIIFSADYVPELHSIISGGKRFHPVIPLDVQSAFERLSRYEENPLRIRSVLYELAANYCDGQPMPELKIENESVLNRMVEYISQHFLENLTLKELSHELGYSYRYMSKIVNRFFKLPFPQIVNRYRVNYACRLLSSPQTAITDVALQCGFGSMRNFNRYFKEILGVTPREFRNNI